MCPPCYASPMSVTPGKIEAAMFTATITESTVAPVSAAQQFMIPLTFSSVANLQTFNGNYTPANDYKYIFQNLPLALAPSFIMVLCDGQLNVTRAYTGSTNSVAVQRFKFCSWMTDPANYLTSCYLEGRLGQPTPMPQGQKVSYTIIVGQATLS